MNKKDFNNFEKLFPKIGAIFMDKRKIKRGTDTKFIIITHGFSGAESFLNGGKICGYEFFGDLTQIRELGIKGHLHPFMIVGGPRRVQDSLDEIWWDARERYLTVDILKERFTLIADSPLPKEAPSGRKRKKS